ncbi:MAG: UvrD-helicase domain-containing protein [Cyanobacteria bacterium P01_A01_bin.68]
MANKSPKTGHFKPYPKNWVNTPTKPLRVPEVFLKEVENYARMRDRSDSGFEVIINLLDTLTPDEMRQIKLAVDSLIGDEKNQQLKEIELSENQKTAYVDKFGFVPSSFQLKIIDWILNGSGNGCCKAVAGAGKSSTLKIVAKTLSESGFRPSDIKICVFGKANSLDLIAKFGNRWKSSISTLHSAGWKLIKQYLQIRDTTNVKVLKNKYKLIAQDLNLIFGHNSKRSILKDQEIIDNYYDFLELIDLVRLTDTEVTTENIIEIARHFEIEKVHKPQNVAYWIKECLKIGEQQAINRECFDFVEQVWLPGHWNLGSEKWFKPYKFVLVDECQDLNEAQKKLIQILAGSDGRILAVGDPNQAVLGFAGADNNSYYNIVKSINAVELPLSICYRCPTSHIKLVKKEFDYIPIEPAPNAIEGVIKQIEPEQIYKYIKNEDMVIGRKTAPLVGLCIRLIGRGKKAIVKGKKIGETLGKECDEIIKLPGYIYELFNDYLSQYRSIKINQYQGLDDEEQLIETINDKLDAVQTIYESNPQAQSIEDLKFEIDKLFSDNNAPITLSTCHRAKGLEAERIFIYHPEHMPLTWRNQQDWQLEQEENLLYVALTRSKSELFICGKCEWYKSPKPEASETIEEKKDKAKNYSKITRATGEEEEDNQDYMELLGVFENYDYF